MADEEATALPYFERRAGTGPTIVFLHYWGGSARTWNPVVDRLHGRATLTVDFRGWSRSRAMPGPYSLSQFARDILAVVTSEGFTDWVLVGHSMGGKVAQLVASARPAGLRGLVLVAPAPAKPASEITPEYQHRLSHAYDSDESVSGVRDGVLTATDLPESVREQIVEDSLAVSGEDARSEWPLVGIAEDIAEQTARVSIPSVVIAGENDQVEPASVLRQNLLPYLEDATLLLIPRTGHLVPLEVPDELAEAIERFLVDL